jgi:hypothetical protein
MSVGQIQMLDGLVSTHCCQIGLQSLTCNLTSKRNFLWVQAFCRTGLDRQFFSRCTFCLRTVHRACSKFLADSRCPKCGTGINLRATSDKPEAARVSKVKKEEPVEMLPCKCTECNISFAVDVVSAAVVCVKCGKKSHEHCAMSTSSARCRSYKLFCRH